ncbi:type II toxin-antitoxin system RelE/ParE family toxin [Nostoc sp. CHAB 5834]|nr:type II toxin-antitoxin system RelE/ParE family toxin [Nostoc sp. CHAB 5834]
MRHIIFRKEAEADLRDIIAHYENVTPESLPNILSDIYRTVDQLVHFPNIGMQVEERNFSPDRHAEISFQGGL